MQANLDLVVSESGKIAFVFDRHPEPRIDAIEVHAGGEVFFAAAGGFEAAQLALAPQLPDAVRAAQSALIVVLTVAGAHATPQLEDEYAVPVTAIQ